jgi:uroporphyrinogen decarboxylase
VLATIRHEIPDRVPVDAICIENASSLAAFLHVEPNEVMKKLGLDGCIVAAPFADRLPSPPGDTPLTEWGTLSTAEYGTGGIHPLAVAANLKAIEQYPWPQADQYDYRQAARIAAQIGTEKAVRGPYWVPLFCRACDLFGMEGAMSKMLLEPTIFEAVLERVLVITAEYCERLLDACGDAMPILCLGDDFATQRGMMIAPDHWRRFLKPRYARLFDIGRRKGKFIWFHSCGNILEVMPDLIDIGMDVWETVQLHTLPIGARGLKREYGRHITFFGGINTQRLPFAEPADVREEVCRVIERLGRNGGYVCGPDHHVKPDVSAENTVALFDAAKSFRRKGYTTE